MTNMIIDWNGNLLWADGNGRVAQMGTSTAQSESFLLATKDFDFGQPAQRKKIYKVYVTYGRQSNNNELELAYAINGGGSFKTISTDFPIHNPIATKSYRVDTLTDFGTSNVYSMRLKLFCNQDANGVTGKDFILNDMSIVFRVKPVN